MKTQIVLFYNTNFFDFVAKVIAFFSNPLKYIVRGYSSIPTHCAFLFDDQTLHEALFPEGYVKALILPKYKNNKYEIYNINNITAEESTNIFNASEKLLGEKYDLFGAIGTVVGIVFKKFGWSLQDPKKVFCAEVIAQLTSEYLKDSLFPTFKIEYVKPADYLPLVGSRLTKQA